MGVTLDQREIDEFLTKGHTLIVSCLDKDGYPHATPVWYVYMDGAITFRARSNTFKAKHLARSPRVSVLVETGERWRDLKAVMVRGRAQPIEDEETQRRYDRLLDEKYASFREASANVPKSTRSFYAVGKVYYKVVPEKKLATWDNQKIRLAAR